MRKEHKAKSITILLAYSAVLIATIVLAQYQDTDNAHASSLEAPNDNSETISQPLPESTSSEMLANCRYGMTSAETTAHAIPSTGAGVFYKFNQPNWYGPLPENNAELLHMIKTRQRKSGGQYLPGWYLENLHLGEELAGYIRDDPGAVWIIGNEVERGPNPGEIWTARTGDMHAEIYAEAYHDIYHFIKGIDPTARVANAGLIQVTPMRLQYLDMMWDAYMQKYGEEMPVDVWTIHTYVLPELTPDGQPNNIASAALGTDLALGKRHAGGDSSKCPDDTVYCYAEHDDISILAEQIISMRQWMKNHNQKEKPLIITEYGTLYHYIVKEDGKCGLRDEFGNCFVPERVTKFMLDSFDYFNNDARDASLGVTSDNNRLVQQWIWYGAWEWDIGSSNLLQNWDSTSFTMMGANYRDHVRSEPTYVNLAVDNVKSTIIAYGDDDLATAKLSVSFRNNGNIAIGDSFKVTFYSDEALTQPIGSTSIASEIRGCATRVYKAEIEWSSLPLGTHPFWVKVDSENEIIESPKDNKDNVGSGQVKATGPVYQLDVKIASDGIGQGGVVTIDPNESAHEEGTVVTLTAVPFAGWNFTRWAGAVVGSNPSAEITMVEDTSVTAHFSQEQYKLDISIVGQGDVLLDPSPLKDHYLFGDVVQLSANPAEEWRFAGWSGDIEDNTPTILLTFDSDIATTAIFKRLLPEINGRNYLPVIAYMN